MPPNVDIGSGWYVWGRNWYQANSYENYPLNKTTPLFLTDRAEGAKKILRYCPLIKTTPLVSEVSETRGGSFNRNRPDMSGTPSPLTCRFSSLDFGSNFRSVFLGCQSAQNQFCKSGSLGEAGPGKMCSSKLRESHSSKSYLPKTPAPTGSVSPLVRGSKKGAVPPSFVKFKTKLDKSPQRGPSTTDSRPFPTKKSES